MNKFILTTPILGTYKVYCKDLYISQSIGNAWISGIMFIRCGILKPKSSAEKNNNPMKLPKIPIAMKSSMGWLTRGSAVFQHLWNQNARSHCVSPCGFKHFLPIFIAISWISISNLSMCVAIFSKCTSPLSSRTLVSSKKQYTNKNTQKIATNVQLLVWSKKKLKNNSTNYNI